MYAYTHIYELQIGKQNIEINVEPIIIQVHDGESHCSPALHKIHYLGIYAFIITINNYTLYNELIYVLRKHIYIYIYKLPEIMGYITGVNARKK